jgi:hypothetical protein
MKKTMQMNLTNRDEIAGLPALSLAEFFRQCEVPIEAEEIGTWFHLDGKKRKKHFADWWTRDISTSARIAWMWSSSKRRRRLRLSDRHLTQTLKSLTFTALF